ncbi:unnamed protein product [Calicophoron daubneyi]|uniref:SOCS box domain-containing protein n=1 Tax=Calicophoron daubneyi TaxID=300641 RepID=A0AAV2TLT7_CALDB
MCALPCSPHMLSSIKVLEQGNSYDLRSLIKRLDLVFVRDADNNTLLHHACMLGNVEAVRLLIDSGLHPNVGNVEGHTPLCDAALHGSVEIVALLLQYGVDVNPPSYWGSPLLYATQNQHLDVMRLLINAGAQIDSPDRTGMCPLHVAVQHQFYAGVHVLLLAGADPNQRMRLTTPLHIAAKMDDLLMARYLIAHGAFPSPIDMDNHTPLDLVSRNSPLFNFLKSVQHQVPSLQSLIRLTLRPWIGSMTKDDIDKLRLPPSICEYLTFVRL